MGNPCANPGMASIGHRVAEKIGGDMGGKV